MIQILIIADDFTGALDTGVQFTKKGVKTTVVTDTGYDFTKPGPAEVLVINAETRHLSPKEAAAIVKDITARAVQSGITWLLKKTDSALRGNIAAELTAMLAATGEKTACFFPAYPAMGRTTKNGTHYIDGVPVAQSVFGKDPFDPVHTSYIPELFQNYPDIKPVIVTAETAIPAETKDNTVYIFDGETQYQMTTALNRASLGKIKVLAGCAGLAAILPEFIKLKKTGMASPCITQGILAVCGSLNPITMKQLDAAGQNGFIRLHLTKEQKFFPDYLDIDTGNKFIADLAELCRRKKNVIIDTFSPNGIEEAHQDARDLGISFEEARELIAKRLGEIIQRWIGYGMDYTLFITGGDTLVGYMNLAKDAILSPVGELSPGVVLSRLTTGGGTLQVVSKSGGFGTENVLLDIRDALTPKHEQGRTIG